MPSGVVWAARVSQLVLRCTSSRGPQSIIQEPQFIPRHKGSGEGDGYIIALVDNLVTNYSDLCIFDALRLPEGPIGRAKLPFRMRSGLHGTWADESKLPKQ